jgi:hypothetical protein
MAYIRRTYGTYLARFFLLPASIRGRAAKGRAGFRRVARIRLRDSLCSCPKQFDTNAGNSKQMAWNKFA